MAEDSLLILLRQLILPPSSNFLLLMIAAFMFLKWRRVALGLAAVSIVSLLLLSHSSVSNSLIKSVEITTEVDTESIKKVLMDKIESRAIVVLGGGRRVLSAEYGDIDTLNYQSLERVKYASWLHKKTQIPILLSGGSPNNEATSEAVLMNQVLLTNFNIAPRWIESNSRNTRENALYSALILEKAGIKEIVLVTHAWHQARARYHFERQGFKVISGSINNIQSQPMLWSESYIPNSYALSQSSLAIKEYLTLKWAQLTE